MFRLPDDKRFIFCNPFSYISLYYTSVYVYMFWKHVGKYYFLLVFDLLCTFLANKGIRYYHTLFLGQLYAETHKLCNTPYFLPSFYKSSVVCSGNLMAFIVSTKKNFALCYSFIKARVALRQNLLQRRNLFRKSNGIYCSNKNVALCYSFIEPRAALRQNLLQRKKELRTIFYRPKFCIF